MSSGNVRPDFNEVHSDMAICYSSIANKVQISDLYFPYYFLTYTLILSQMDSFVKSVMMQLID